MPEEESNSGPAGFQDAFGCNTLKRIKIQSMTMAKATSPAVSQVPQCSAIATEQPGFVGCLVQSFPGSPKLSRGVRKKTIQANRDDANLSMYSSRDRTNSISRTTCTVWHYICIVNGTFGQSMTLLSVIDHEPGRCSSCGAGWTHSLGASNARGRLTQSSGVNNEPSACASASGGCCGDD